MPSPYLEIKGLTKRIGHRVLFADISFTINEREHIGLIAKNGTGKSTLLSIIAGKEGDDGGTMIFRNDLKVGYLEQTPTIEAQALEGKSEEYLQRYKRFLTQMKITEEEAARQESQLSGGQIKRIALSRVLAGEPDLLILDEPTNHLDIASREWIEDALSDYEQTLIFVSHDRYFINRFATRVLSFEGNGVVTDYKGTYQDFLDWRERQQVFAEADRARKTRDKKPDSRPERAPDLSRSSAKIEREIEKLEAQVAKLDAEAEAASSDYIRLMELDTARKDLDEKLEALYERWEELNA